MPQPPGNAQRAAIAPKPAPTWLPIALGVGFAVVFVALAWEPRDRETWLLENLIAAPFALALVLFRRRIPFSARSWLLVFTLLALHEVGSHYTYSHVPWMEWSRELLGWAPAWERNHYDRFLHLVFGLTMTRPYRDLLAVPLAASPALLWWLPICVVSTASHVYEILEWAAAQLSDPGVGIAFVGAQGDVWDAQKDMALALVGSCLVTAGAWVRSRFGGG